MKNSVSIHHDFMFNFYGMTSARWGEYDDTLEDYRSSDFQKAIWWYNGAKDAGNMAIPPAFTAWELLKEGNYKNAVLRIIFGMPKVINGIPQTKKTGMIDVPTLFVCGKNDEYILCNNEYALNTKNYITSDYRHLVVDCGHDLTSCGGDEQAKINKMIFTRISTAESS